MGEDKLCGRRDVHVSHAMAATCVMSIEVN